MTPLVLVIWGFLAFIKLTAHPMAPVTTAAPRNLSCYECFKVNLPSQCQPYRCSPDERVCISQQLLLQKGHKILIQISKRCATQCFHSNSFFEWSPTTGIRGSLTRSCCSRNLCNTAPAASEGLWALLGRLLLPVGLGLLCTLLPGPLSWVPFSPTSTSCPPP